MNKLFSLLLLTAFSFTAFAQTISIENSKWKNYFEENKNEPVHVLLRRGLDYMNPPKGALAVDAGCGQGIETEHLLQRGRAHRAHPRGGPALLR